MRHLLRALALAWRVRQQSLLGMLLFAVSSSMAADRWPQGSLVAIEGEPTVESFIEHLPTAMRNNYVLVFQSRSIQGASRANPRAILFTPDAHLVVTFNGESSQRGFADVEVMRFDPASKAFSFQEIHFSGDAVTLSEVNPPKCTTCHGNPPRPVWDSFPLWPGVYGEHYRARLSSYERSGLGEFLAQRLLHPRYKSLLNADRLAQPETFRPSTKQTYSAEEREPPNFRFSRLLAQLNFQNIAAQVSSHPDFASAKYPLLASLAANCQKLAPYLPELRDGSLLVELQAFRAQSRRENARARDSSLRRTADLGRLSEFDGMDDLADFRFVTERLLNIDTGSWTMALEKNTFDFSSPLSPDFLFRILLQTGTTADSTLGELAAVNTTQEDRKFCSYLHKRTAATASTRKQSIEAVNTGNEPKLLTQCALCHTAGPGPTIVFNEAGELSRQLRKVRANGHTLLDEIALRLSPEAGARRMPMGSLPPDEDVRDLLDYFRRLSTTNPPQRSTPR